jgi:DNA-binding IclR family transcriptional regulator
MQYTVPQSRTVIVEPNAAGQAKPSRDVTVQAVVRAFAVLDVLGAAPSSSLTEVAQRLRMHKSTVHRLLATLERVGYVVQDEATQRYRLTLEVLDLAASVLASIDIRTKALPVMHRLVQEVQETAHLGVLIDGEIVCIESLASARPFAVMRLVGKHGAAHVSSMGKVILAHQREDVVERIISEKGLPRFTEYSITDPQAFRAHLTLVRSRGWAVNAEEEEPGLGCVAAPIWDHRGEVVAALSIAAPTVRMEGMRLDQLVEAAVLGAQEVTLSLGYRAAS